MYICSRLSCLQIDLPKKNHRLSCWTCNKSTSSCGSPMIGNTNGNWYLTVELFWFFWTRGVRYLSNCQKGRVYHLSFRGWDGRWFPSKLVGGVDRTCPSYLVISGSLFGYQQSNLEMEDMLQGLGKYWLWKMAILSISLQIHRLRRCEDMVWCSTIQLIFHELLGERGLVRISWLTRHAANSRFAVRFAGTNLKAQAFLMPSQQFLFSGCASLSFQVYDVYVCNFIQKWIMNRKSG